MAPEKSPVCAFENTCAYGRDTAKGHHKVSGVENRLRETPSQGCVQRGGPEERVLLESPAPRAAWLGRTHPALQPRSPGPQSPMSSVSHQQPPPGRKRDRLRVGLKLKGFLCFLRSPPWCLVVLGCAVTVQMRPLGLGQPPLGARKGCQHGRNTI